MSFSRPGSGKNVTDNKKKSTTRYNHDELASQIPLRFHQDAAHEYSPAP